MCSRSGQVIETGDAASSTNMGFRGRNNTMYTYQQQHTAFPYLYCKRVMHQDSLTTLPLDVTLSTKEKHAKEQEDQAYIRDGA